jgi:hypothetical protein
MSLKNYKGKSFEVNGNKGDYTFVIYDDVDGGYRIYDSKQSYHTVAAANDSAKGVISSLKRKERAEDGE